MFHTEKQEQRPGYSSEGYRDIGQTPHGLHQMMLLNIRADSPSAIAVWSLILMHDTE